MRKYSIVFTMVLALITTGGYAAQAQNGSGPCDRACLENFVDQYLDAVIAHNPKLLPLSRNVKFTEKGVKLEIGDAHWKTVIGKGKYRIFVADPEAGQVAFIGTVREEARGPEGIPTALALRLKIENRQISEIETLLIRSSVQNGGRGGGAPVAPTGAAVNMEGLGMPHHLFTETVPPAERM